MQDKKQWLSDHLEKNIIKHEKGAVVGSLWNYFMRWLHPGGTQNEAALALKIKKIVCKREIYISMSGNQSQQEARDSNEHNSPIQQDSPDIKPESVSSI